jgi:exodeoxyribonuclease-1
MQTFLWHDYETSGADPRRDRPLQFAGVRSNHELEPVGDPVVVWCKPARDLLPQPMACLVTGITPQQAERDGVVEAEFAARVHETLAEPGTCGVGFNSMRFDDEVTRALLYRNFHEPYAREWKENCSRWDLIDVLRMAYALRPRGIEWPEHAAGGPSFRLEDLANANGVRVGAAHDALSDVEATLALARKLRAAQPKLFAFLFELRDKRRSAALLDWQKAEAVVHSSSRIAAERGCTTIIAPLAAHPTQQNAVIVYDLMTDPADLLALPVDEIQDRVFVSRDALPEGVERIPLKLVRCNRAPALAPLSVLKGADLARIKLDPERCRANLERLRAAGDELRAKLRAVFARPEPDRPDVDADLALVSGGFLRDDEAALRAQVRRGPPEALAALGARFRDGRYPELLFRYRARNWPETLASDERARWREHRRARLLGEHPGATIALPEFFEQVAAFRAQTPEGRRQALCDALEAWGLQLRREIDVE